MHYGLKNMHSKNGFVVTKTVYVKCSAESHELGYTCTFKKMATSVEVVTPVEVLHLG